MKPGPSHCTATPAANILSLGLNLCPSCLSHLEGWDNTAVTPPISFNLEVSRAEAPNAQHPAVHFPGPFPALPQAISRAPSSSFLPLLPRQGVPTSARCWAASAPSPGCCRRGFTEGRRQNKEASLLRARVSVNGSSAPRRPRLRAQPGLPAPSAVRVPRCGQVCAQTR